MSTDPKPEHRISAVEKRTTRIEGLIEEMSADTAESLNALQQDIKKLEDGMMSSFKELGSYFELSEAAINKRLGSIESDITSIKSTQEQILKLLQEKP